jgi:hypothetical protein
MRASAIITVSGIFFFSKVKKSLVISMVAVMMVAPTKQDFYRTLVTNCSIVRFSASAVDDRNMQPARRARGSNTGQPNGGLTDTSALGYGKHFPLWALQLNHRIFSKGIYKYFL